jgi:hypothetical protein
MRRIGILPIARLANVLLGLGALTLGAVSLGALGNLGNAQKSDNLRSMAQSKTAQLKKPVAKPKTIPRSEYMSDEVCAPCHKDIFESYERTAHHLTSQIPSKDSIRGTFGPGANTMATANPNLMFRMEEKGGGEFFQTAIWGPPAESTRGDSSPNSTPTEGTGTRTRTERLDLVIGSGGKGQTYLYWRDDQLFQLPAGYSTVLYRWINSPGYEDGVADFERGIIPRCLECHATYSKAAFPDPDINIYDRENFELGISCGRCLGPERTYVANYASKNPVPGFAEIVNPAKLSAARQADICAQCHGGQSDRQLMPAFSYLPGQALEKYIDLGPIDSAKDVDVHGKQGKLLMKSEEPLLPDVEELDLLDLPRRA